MTDHYTLYSLYFVFIMLGGRKFGRNLEVIVSLVHKGRNWGQIRTSALYKSHVCVTVHAQNKQLFSSFSRFSELFKNTNRCRFSRRECLALPSDAQHSALSFNAACSGGILINQILLFCDVLSRFPDSYQMYRIHWWFIYQTHFVDTPLNKNGRGKILAVCNVLTKRPSILLTGFLENDLWQQLLYCH